MKPTSRAVRDELDNFLTYLLRSEIALFINTVAVDGSRVSWHSFHKEANFLAHRGHPSIADYRRWIENGAYSAVLFDGSLLQITFDVDGQGITGHRLAYVPAPFAMDLELLQAEPLAEVIDMYAAGPTSDVILHAALRFDYDPNAAAPGHPAAHFTVNSTECRIACAAPLRLGHFANFVFRNFYPALWTANPYLHGLSRKDWGQRTVTNEETNHIHLHWSAQL
jgi:hypothetical protein